MADLMLGPYETQTWYDPKRDRLFVKFRTTEGAGEKKGMIFWLHEEDLRKLMETIRPGMEYPKYQAIVQSGLTRT